MFNGYIVRKCALSMWKQRKESAAIYREKGRTDIAEEEEFQAAIIEKYLPEQISEEEIAAVVDRIIEETGASTMKDMGRVMGMATKELAGKADNKTISNLVRTVSATTNNLSHRESWTSFIPPLSLFYIFFLLLHSLQTE